jgi:polysaccharide deacetylase 2 family uncharacterized protein YibQ
LSRRRSARKGPLRIGAAVLFLSLAAVVAIIVWPGREPSPPPAPSIPLPAPAPAPAAETSAAPQSLTDLLSRYLADRRLDVERGQRGVDLVCAVPPGRSAFRIHADLAEAMRLWGGTAVAGEEAVVKGVGRVIDLTVTRSGESRVIRLRELEEADGPPRIAIVIDDFGHQSQALIDGFLKLPFAFTPAVLPDYARSVATVRRACDAGRPPILHLPMEPRDAAQHDPGDGAIRTGMSPDEIRRLLEADLRALDGVVAVSNHMGSLACERSELVGPLLDEMRARRLFFLDNGTSERSVVPAEAARRGVRCLSADLYLDGEANPTPEMMKRRLNEARRIAESCGSVIMVGHARPATLQFLSASQDSFRAWGCRPVPLSDLLR